MKYIHWYIFTITFQIECMTSKAVLSARASIKPSAEFVQATKKEIIKTKTILFQALENGDKRKIFKALLLLRHLNAQISNKRITVNTITDDQGNTPLHIAASHGQNKLIDVLVQKYKANVNALNKHNRTPLHLAAQGGKLSTVQRLFAKYNANPNTVSKYGTSPLYSATIKNYTAIISYLVETCGVSIYGKNRLNPIQAAARTGQQETLHYFLEDKDCLICQEPMASFSIDNTVILPCCHQALCRQDYDLIIKCPVCRTKL